MRTGDNFLYTAISWWHENVSADNIKSTDQTSFLYNCDAHAYTTTCDSKLVVFTIKLIERISFNLAIISTHDLFARLALKNSCFLGNDCTSGLHLLLI